MSFLKILFSSFLLVAQLDGDIIIESEPAEASEAVEESSSFEGEPSDVEEPVTDPVEPDSVEPESVEPEAENFGEESTEPEFSEDTSPDFESEPSVISPAPVPPVTNSGQPFNDPFAGDQPAQPSFNSPDFQQGPASQESELPPQPTVEPQFSQPAAPPPPAPSFQSPATPAESPAINPGAGFEFPSEDNNRGPISQDVKLRRAASRQADVGTWHGAFRPGAGFNLNRRPTQVSFELEAGYRMWEKIDLNLITHYRFISDRVLGFIFLPTYTFTLSGKEALNRMDLRLGLGTGWIFRGVSGSGFQFGEFPIRSDVEFSYYFQPTLAFLLQLGTETHLAESSTGGSTVNQLSHPKGAPTQLLTHVGFRMEF